MALIYTDFKGGLSEAAPGDMDDNQLIEARNAEPDEKGSISKCLGTAAINEPYAQEPISRLIEFGKEVGTVEYLAFHGTTARLWNTNKKAAEIGAGDNGKLKVIGYGEDTNFEVNVDNSIDEQRDLKVEAEDGPGGSKTITILLAAKGDVLPVVDIGGGTDGTVTIRERDPDKSGGGYSVTVVIPDEADADMEAELDGKSLTVTLGTMTNKTPDPLVNKASLVAKAINDIEDNPLIAEFSGTGETALSSTVAEQEITLARAKACIGSGADGEVNIVMSAAGTEWNAFTVEVKVAVGTKQPMTAVLNDKDLLITLGTYTTPSTPYAKYNTAKLIAAEINRIENRPFTASHTGTGTSSITGAAAKKSFTSGRNCLDSDANKVSLVARAVRECEANVSGAYSGTGEDPLRSKVTNKTPSDVSDIIKDDLPGPPTDYDVYNDMLYWLDGENFWRYDGGYIEEVTKHTDGEEETWKLIKKCHFIEQRGQRHFFARKDTNTMYYSEVGNPNYIKGDNFIKAVTDDSDLIVAIKEYAGALLVFKNRAIYSWYGWDPDPIEGDVRFDQVMVHRGAIAQDTICVVEGYLMYCAFDGVYALTSPYPQQINSINLSERKVDKKISESINKERACAVYFKNSYRLSISTGGTQNTEEYRYYPKLQSWFGPFTHPVSCYLITKDYRLYSGSPLDATIFEHETGRNYGGSPIEYRIKTKPLDIIEGLADRMRVSRVYLAFQQYLEETCRCEILLKCGYSERSFKFTVSADESLVWNEGAWDETFWDWDDLAVKEIRAVLRGKRFQIVLENKNLDEPCTFYGFKLKAKPKKAKGSKFAVEEVTI